MRRYVSLLLAAGLAVLGGCSDDDPSANEIQDNLTFTRQSGSVMATDMDYAVCCAAWEAGYHDALTFKVLVGGASGGWKLFLLADDVVVDSTYAFPTGDWGGGGSWNGPPLSLFFVDPQDGNELSGSDIQSTGAITVTALDCGPPARIAFSIDARVYSEIGGPWVEVSGTFSAAVHRNTLFPDCDFSL
jgi:hypothetical protein